MLALLTQCPPLSVCESATSLCPAATKEQNLESQHSWRWQEAFMLNARLVQALFCSVSPTSRPVSDMRRLDCFTFIVRIKSFLDGGNTARGGLIIGNY